MVDYSALNDAQREAVETTEGYIRVIASAGSGKTRALAYRFAYLVEKKGIAPKNIACVTFTNKAAREMRDRIRGMLGSPGYLYVCTFHGLGVRILHEEIKTIGWPTAFRIMDDDDMSTLLRRICTKLDCRLPNLSDIKAYITQEKTNNGYRYVESLTGMPKVLRRSGKETVEDKDIFEAYLNEQKRGACLDFNDLICIPLYLFEKNPQIQKKWAERFKYVMVDEFQDVSGENFRFCDAISSFHKNLFVVGDPDQLIYTWRGAEMKYIIDFEKLYPGAKTIMMSTNYRSSGEIIGRANELVEKNQNRLKKTMVPNRPDLEKVDFLHCEQLSEAAAYVADEIIRQRERGVKYRDMALLYRLHTVSGSYEKELIRRKIPYVVCSGTPFYQRKEIKDIIAYLGLVNRENTLDFIRALSAPDRGFSQKDIDDVTAAAEAENSSLLEKLEFMHREGKGAEFAAMIRKYAKQKDQLSVSELLADLFKESGLEAEYSVKPDDERMDYIMTLKSQVVEMEKEKPEKMTLQEFLDEVGTYTGADNTTSKDSVRLMSVHGAKGLEFPVVFCVGMNEGTFPSYKAETPKMMEEERRLAYVAYTRARDHLYIVEAEKSGYEGRTAYPSRFIFNADIRRMNTVRPVVRDYLMMAWQFIKQSEANMGYRPDGTYDDNTEGEWNIGMKVVHSVFGDGRIVSVQGDMVTVAFSASGAQRSLRKEKLSRV